VKLDLDYLEDKTRYAQSTPTTAITKEELALLVRIAKAAQSVPFIDMPAELIEAFDAAGLHDVGLI
jgi:hypothetical protein